MQRNHQSRKPLLWLLLASTASVGAAFAGFAFGEAINPPDPAVAFSGIGTGIAALFYGFAAWLVTYTACNGFIIAKTVPKGRRLRVAIALVIAPVLGYLTLWFAVPNNYFNVAMWVLCVSLPAWLAGIALGVFRARSFVLWVIVIALLVVAGHLIVNARNAQAQVDRYHKWSAPLFLSQQSNFDSPLPGYKYYSTTDPQNDGTPKDDVESEWINQTPGTYHEYMIDFFKHPVTNTTACSSCGNTTTYGPVMQTAGDIGLSAYAVNVPGGSVTIAGDDLTPDQAATVFNSLEPATPDRFVKAIRASGQ